MVMYDFQCDKCRKVYTVPLNPHSDDLSHQDCEKCGTSMTRIYNAQIGHIDWVNGGFHGEDVNLGLGKKFKSARERDYYAATHGFVKQDKAGGDLVDHDSYNRRKAAKERAEKRVKEKANG